MVFTVVYWTKHSPAEYSCHTRVSDPSSVDLSSHFRASRPVFERTPVTLFFTLYVLSYCFCTHCSFLGVCYIVKLTYFTTGEGSDSVLDMT